MRQRDEQFIYAGKKAARTEQLGTAWPVYRDFEVEEKEGDVYVYAPFRPPEREAGLNTRLSSPFEEDLGLERVYAPLREQPDLFLRFASLAREGEITRDEAFQIMLEWVTSYGVLGLEDVDRLESDGGWEHRMGRRESLVRFAEAVREAARCLTLYEAAEAPGGPDVEALERMGVRGNTPEEMKEDALRSVDDQVNRQMVEECYPLVYRQFHRESGETVRSFQGWGFRSLLGAMYLQMMWLITEASNVRRCKGPGCFRIITFDAPEQVTADPGLKKNARGKYRTRRDKEFCSRNCKEKWRYHYVVKPRRQKSRGWNRGEQRDKGRGGLNPGQ